MTANVFKDKETLGAELVRFHRSHSGQPIEKFLKFILAPHLLKLMAKKPEAMHEADSVIFDMERDKDIYPELTIDEKMLDTLVESSVSRLPIPLTKDFDVAEPSVGMVYSIRREGSKLIAKIKAPDEVWEIGHFAIGIAFDGDPKTSKTPPQLHNVTWVTKPVVEPEKKVEKKDKTK